ncbi:MAG: hypothetical protein FWG98_06410 [Candidatus Cloacimonetes bacterium]|nr:hypothetical protein [Candidatus Cloacimonadota bacterium]
MKMSQNQRPANSRQLKLAVLLALCLNLILFVGCSSKEKTDEPTLEFIIRFEEVIAYSNENFDGADVRLKLITKTPGGEINHLFSDMSKGEQTWKINKNSPFFGISVEVLNTENIEFDDWVSFGEKFFFNTNHNPEVIDGYFRWHLPFSFTELNSIIIVVLDQIFDTENDDRQYIIFVNDEEIDIEDLIVLGAGKPNRPSNIREDNRDIYQTSNLVLPYDTLGLLRMIKTRGDLYEFNLGAIFGGGTHNETFGHIQGFAMQRHNFIFSHSDVSWKTPRIYFYNTLYDIPAGINTEAIYQGHYEELGSLQVIGDYLALSYGHGPRRVMRHTANSTMNVATSAFQILSRSSSKDGADTAVGIVAVPANVKYTDMDTHGYYESLKYILITAQNDSNNFQVHVTRSENFDDYQYQTAFNSALSDAHYNNIQLLVDINNDIWMFGFKRYNDYMTIMNIYKLTYDVDPNSHRDKRFYQNAESLLNYYLAAPDDKTINGAYGASVHYDGFRIHIFMSARNAKKSGSDKGRIYYAHWST